MYTWKTIMRSIVIKLIYKDLSVIEGEINTLFESYQIGNAEDFIW